MRMLRSALLGCALLAVGGCYSAPVIPPIGGIYSDYSAPIDIDADNTKMSMQSGEAESFGVLGLVAWGDCSINSAAKNGGLTTIDHVDYKFYNIIGVWQVFTTKVYGTK